MDQPPVLHHAGAAAPEPAVAMAGTDVWESDLADLAALPLSAVDGLPTLSPTTRLLTEVLRARSSMRSGEGGGSGARAD
ncbi:hypothetical protein PV963_34490 [Streptomyces coeruleorubidus]|uniref:hypothetical protein n=1 Tax=Streptomyces coeruleorubidus TaxID=116188 RepID=UPI00237F4801|nr:hypothetical protein [Streptomyces coeruleorubidus]WDV55103.1 hypothetical protein PV963_34490 [Streptomyces coeruleorubidus]